MFAYFALRNYSEIPVFSRYLRVILYGLLAQMFCISMDVLGTSVIEKISKLIENKGNF